MKIYYYPDVEEFIDLLNESVKLKIVQAVDLLEEFGPSLSLPHSKKLEKGLYELRTYGSQNVRVFYIFDEGNAILLHVFIKKTPRIPKKELEIARKRRKRFT